MKKLFFIVLLVVLSFAKTSLGQAKDDPISLTILDTRYEYHPHPIDIERGEMDFQKIHTGRFGLLGMRFNLVKKYGYDSNGKKKIRRITSLEWQMVEFMVSSSWEEPYGACFLNFNLRTGKRRFWPCLNLSLVEFTKNKFADKFVIHHSIAGGFEYYFTDISILTFKVGLRYEMPSDFYYMGRLSPFAGIGYKLDLNWNDY